MSSGWYVTNRSIGSDEPIAWDLVVGGRCVASVWKNAGHVATWHTFDENGGGGENDVEHGNAGDNVCRRAMAEATLSAVNQGFIRLSRPEVEDV